MLNKNLFIFAIISPKEKYFKSAKKALLNIIEATKEEEGCIQFELHEDRTYLYLYEEWKDKASLDTHYEKEYTKKVFKKYENWLLKPVEVIKMNKLVRAK